MVHFPNHVFGEAMATVYADFLNGEAKVKAEVEKVAPKVESAVDAALATAKKIIADAKLEERKIKDEAQKAYRTAISAAESEGEKIIADAKATAGKVLDEAKRVQAEVFTNAKNEAEKIVGEAEAKVKPLAVDVEKDTTVIEGDVTVVAKVAETDIEKL